MKFVIVALAFVAAATAQFNQNYNPGQYDPFRYNQRYNKYNRFSTPTPFRPYYSSTVAPPVYSTFAPAVYSTPAPVPVISKVYNPDASYAKIVKYDNEVNPDGSYNYFYETENGIAAQEEGQVRNFEGNPPSSAVVAQGSYSYTAPDGTPVSVSYVANENGFQPQGNVIPNPPPVPELIARSLEYIRNYKGQSK